MRGKDKVTVISGKTGEKIPDVVCTVTSDTTIIQRTKIVIEPGDLLQRKMSNGAEETYEVIDPQFHEEDGGTYIVQQKKLGIRETEKTLQNINYSFSGDNARVNNNSVDNSTNQVIVNSEISEKLESLKVEILQHTEGKQKAESLEIHSALEQQLSEASPSKVVVSTLLAGLPAVGSIASIAGLIASLL